MAWVSLDRQYNPTIMGEMSGMSGMDQGVGLDIVPSFAAVQQRRFNPAGSLDQLNPSLDAFYRLTPSLNAALTLNTDFSAVEVDNRQVNLTRFNLFFPERRDFFNNDSELFQFGNITGLARGNNAAGRCVTTKCQALFFRKLGLAGDGSPVDIEYGGRISGRVGRFNIGTLAIRQADTDTVAATDLLISRVSANVHWRIPRSGSSLLTETRPPIWKIGSLARIFNTSITGCRTVAACSAQSFFSSLVHPGWPGKTPLTDLALAIPRVWGCAGVSATRR